LFGARLSSTGPFFKTFWVQVSLACVQRSLKRAARSRNSHARATPFAARIRRASGRAFTGRRKRERSPLARFARRPQPLGFTCALARYVGSMRGIVALPLVVYPSVAGLTIRSSGPLRGGTV